MLFFIPRGVLDEILNLIESVSEGFPSYFFLTPMRLQYRTDIGRGLIDRVMTKTSCYDLFIIQILVGKDLQKIACQLFLKVVETCFHA